MTNKDWKGHSTGPIGLVLTVIAFGSSFIMLMFVCFYNVPLWAPHTTQVGVVSSAVWLMTMYQTNGTYAPEMPSMPSTKKDPFQEFGFGASGWCRWESQNGDGNKVTTATTSNGDCTVAWFWTIPNSIPPGDPDTVTALKLP